MAKKEELLLHHIISISGLERGDVPYYLAQAITARKKGKRILIADNSASHDIYDSLLFHQESDEVRMAGEVHVIKDVGLSPQLFGEFDSVILYQGKHTLEQLLSVADRTFLLVDYAEAARGKAIKTDAVILMNRAGNKVTPAMVYHRMEIPVAIPYLELEVDEQAYAAYLRLLWKGKSSVGRAGKPMQELIKQMLELCTQEVE